MAQESKTVSTGKNFVYVPDPTGTEILNGQKVTKQYFQIDTTYKLTDGKPDPSTATQKLTYFAGIAGAPYEAARRDFSKGENNWSFLKTQDGKDILGDSFRQAINDPKSPVSSSINNQGQLSIQKNAGGAPIPAAQAKSALTPNGNAAPTNPEGSGTSTPTSGNPGDTSGAGGSDSSKAAASASDYNKITFTSIKESQSFGPADDYTYPLKIAATTQDVITFTMREYSGKKLNEKQLGFSDRAQGKAKGSVTLGIQPAINDQNTVNWNGTPMGMLELAGAGLNLDFVEGGELRVDKIKGSYGAEAENLQKAFKISMAEQAVQTKGLLSRISGGIANPNLELLFEGPSLRSFTFTFKMSPREQAEANNVRRIIRFFKQGMAVQRTPGFLFLRAPNVFDIRYLDRGGGRDHKSLNRFKGPCALQACNVDYAPAGSYMTFDDPAKTMISYTLSLTFSELEPLYEDEYQSIPVDDIGF